MSIMDFLNSDETKKFEKALEKIVTFMNDDDIKSFLIEYEKFVAQSAQKEIKKTERPKKTSEKYLVEYFPGYTKEQIINAFQNLIQRYQEILIRAYGDNLDKPVCSGNFTKEEKVLLKNARSSLKVRLRNPIPQIKNKKLIELIPDYTMGDIKAAFEKLNPKYQEILTRAYGDNLDKPLCTEKFTKEERSLLNNARSSLKVKLGNPNLQTKNKKLTEIMPGYTMEDIKTAFEKINSWHQEILTRAYGDNLDKPVCRTNFTEEEKTLLGNAQTSLKVKLRNPNSQPKNKKLTELISGYTMEDIKDAFEKLNPKYQEILTRAYGDNLDKPVCTENFTRKEKILLASAKKSLKVRLRNPIPQIKNKKLIELNPDYTMEDIKDAFEKLNPKHQEILTRAYGDNLDKPVCRTNFTEDEKPLLGCAQTSLKVRLRNPIPQIKNKKLIELNPDYTMEDIKAAFEKLKPKHQEILTRAYGDNLDKPVCRTNFTEDEKTLLGCAQKRLKGKLRNPTQIKNKKITELISGYTMEDIKTAFEKLNPKYQEILTRAYGDNLDKPVCRENFTEEEKTLLKNARELLKVKLRNPNPQSQKKQEHQKMKKKYIVRTPFEKTIGKTLKDFFPGYTKEQIQTMCIRLKPDYQNILRKAYGLKLDRPLSIENLTRNEKRILYRARDFLGRKLNGINPKQNVPEKNSTGNPAVKLSKINKNLYEIFSEYTKEEVDKAIKFLPKEARNILLIFFGGNYNEPGNYSYLPEDSHKDLGCALEKLNESLKKLIKERTSNLPTNVVKTDAGLYRVDKFNLISFFTKHGCTKVQIVYFYLNLDKKEKDLMIKVCGQTLEDSDGFVLFDHNELQTFKNTIKKLKQLLFDNLKSKKPIEKKVRLTSIYERFSEYPKETVDFVISQVDSKVIERFKKFFYNENLNNESIVFVSQDDYNFLCNVLAMIEKRLKINSKNARNVSRKKNVSMIINEKDRKKIVVPSKEKMQWFAKMLELPGKEREALINQLDDSDIALLKKAYGPYYTLKLNGELTAAELTRLNRIFIHIKYLYASTHKATKFMASNKTLSESLGVDQLVATDLVYQLLGESEIELLKITYGENLSNKRHNSILTTYEKKLVNKIIGFLRSEIEKQIELDPDGQYKLVHRL